MPNYIKHRDYGQAHGRATRLFAFLAVLCLARSIEAAEVTVGGDKITIPALPGFTDVTTIAPDTVAMFQGMCPTNNRILALFATTTDAGHLLLGENAAMRRHLVAQSVRSLEHTTMSASMFADVRKEMRGEYEALILKSKPQIDALAESVGRDLTKRLGGAASIKIGQMLPLSINIDSPYTISLSTLSKSAFQYEGKQWDFVSAQTMSMTLLKHRVVYLYAFSTYDSDEDLTWTRDTSARWAVASLAANSKTFDSGVGSIVPPGTRVDTVVSALMTETQASYSTAGHPKSRGLKVSVKYPSSWKANEGIRPHIVQKFTGEHVGGITPMCIIIVQELPTIVKVLLDRGGNEELFSDGGADLIPSGAKHLDSASTKIDGQAAAWVKFCYDNEQAGVRTSMYCLQFMTYYRGTMFTLQCAVHGLADSPEILRDAFSTYLPLFQNIANSIVIEDKWNHTPTSGDVVTSAIKDTYGEYWWISLIVSAILTWGIGLMPPLLIRFALVKHALSKPSALVIVVALWILSVVFFTVLRGTNMTHGALLLVAWASYAILRKGSAIYDAQMATDAAMRRQRDEARRKAEEANRRAEEERRENDTQQQEERRRREDQRRNSREPSSSRVKDERYYASVLGLDGSTTADDVRRRYRELATQYHPDKVNHLGHKLKEVAESEMKEINAAYDYFKQKYGIG